MIWASTTFVPEGETGRFAGDEDKYNQVAAKIMARHHVATDDLHTLTKSLDRRYSIDPSNVHYTSDGSARIARQVAGAIEKALLAKN